MPDGTRTGRGIVAIGLAALCIAPGVLAGESDGESGAPVKTYGQALVDRTVNDHPELIALNLHVRPPDGEHGMIIASKRRDRVGEKLEIRVPLQDTAGKTIGAMQAVYAYDRGEDEARFLSRAQALSGEMQRQIPTMARLGQPARPTDGLDIGGTQSLPTTKQVVSGKALSENEQEGYAEAIKNVAGVAPGNSKGSANDSVNIRGIKLNLFSNYRLNGGVPIAGVITMPIENKARLETLKGANALQYGVASPAGIVNMIPKRAGENDVLSISGAGSNFGQYGGTVDVGHRFGDGKEFGMRLNASATASPCRATSSTTASTSPSRRASPFSILSKV